MAIKKNERNMTDAEKAKQSKAIRESIKGLKTLKRIGATNRTSGYLNPKAAGNRNATPKTYTTTTKSGIKITASGSSSGGGTGNKSVKPGSMVTQTKVVKDKPAAPKKMTCFKSQS
jgi:endo-alpha-1,4-polygalactosaminidase (GH114 family)